MTAYYNENDPKAAAWLRELIAADVIVRGEIDERDIRDVTVSDLSGFTQCHFFAGIGGWSYALRLAGWPDDRPVWTGSCPCQPFSSAGKGRATADERHLWPTFYRLIAHACPAVVFGEQVASPAGLQWLNAVQVDLEDSGYAVGVADLPAACVGAPHIRQRLFWLAESVGQRRQGLGLHLQPRPTRLHQFEVGRHSEVGIALGDTGRSGLSQRIGDGHLQREAVEPFPRQAAVGTGHVVDVGQPAGCGFERFGDEPTHGESVQTDAHSHLLADTDLILGGQGSAELRGRDPRGDEESGSGSGGGELPGELGDPGCHGARQHTGELLGDESQHEERAAQRDHASVSAGTVGDLAHSSRGERSSRWTSSEDGDGSEQSPGCSDDVELANPHGGNAGAERLQRGGQHGQFQEDGRVSFWSDCDWLPCRDGKSRPVEPSTFPLAHGVSGRVGLLRGYGNAIVPQVAAEFIAAYLDTLD